MTTYDVAAFKWGCAHRTAERLGVQEDFLDLSELLERIEGRDAKAAELLTGFFQQYDAWFELSTRMNADEGVRTSHQAQLLDRIHDRDDARQMLIQHLAKR